MILFISSFEIINVAVPDPNIFLGIAASFVAAAVDPNSTKTLLANGFSTFFIKGNLVFGNGPKNLFYNPPYYPILGNWVFDNFILAEELFVKALRSFEIYVLVNNNLCVKLFSY